MKRTTLIILSIFIITQYGHAQNKARSFLGLGLGLDYGGIGTRFEFVPVKPLGLFGGLGYNLINVGYNAGANFKLVAGKRGTPIISAMYGYNGAIKIKNVVTGKTEGHTYNGVTAGIGFEVFNKKLRNKLVCQALIPFRSSRFRKDYDNYKKQGAIFQGNVPDVTFSIGYHFGPSGSK